MSVFILVEQSTDQNRPETKIKIVYSESAAQKYVNESGKSGRFSSPCPEIEQNFHHTFRTAYEMPAGWRRPSKKKLDEFVWGKSYSSRRKTANDILAGIAFSQKIREINKTPTSPNI